MAMVVFVKLENSRMIIDLKTHDDLMNYFIQFN